MINSPLRQFCEQSFTLHLSEYLADKQKQDKRVNYIIITLVISSLIFMVALSKPIFASTPQTPQIIKTDTVDSIYQQKRFEENIKNKYLKAHINFPTEGIAHIKKTKYINSKPIKINIVEIDTTLNKNLKIKPQVANINKLSSKTTLRKIAEKQGAIVAINGGFFKPQTGVPLGALVIDEKIITGPIYNRAGIAIFDDGEDINFKLENIAFKIKAILNNEEIILDNINQPRMLSTHKLIYTSNWGEYSPIAQKNCLNLLIQNNKAAKISTSPIKLNENDFVIQAPKETIEKFKLNQEVKISFNLQENLKHAKHIIAGGPYLVKDSEIYVDYKTEKLSAIYGKNPRSAIGFNEENLIIVTIDGREESSVGMTLIELARFMKSIGCKQAMNFDGGSSSALYVNGKIVNSAVNKEGIAISNALLISEIKENEEIKVSSVMR